MVPVRSLHMSNLQNPILSGDSSLVVALCYLVPVFHGVGGIDGWPIAGIGCASLDDVFFPYRDTRINENKIFTSN